MEGRNCPNCGAAINPEKNKCEYCGTSYFDLSCIPLNELFFLKINVGTREKPRIITQKVYTEGCTLTQEPCLSCYGGMNTYYPEMTYDFHFISVGGYTVETK